MLDPFLEMMAAERGASAHTLDAYRRDLVDFGAFVRLRGRERTNADADDIRAYLASLAADGMRASTSARRLSALRQYYRFLFLEGRRTDDPTLHIDAPKKAPAAAEAPERGGDRGPDRGRTGPRGRRRACGSPPCSSCSTPRACGSRS